MEKLFNIIINKSFLDQYTGTKTEFKDIAFSGNGEPTASEDFGAVTKILIQKISKFNLNQKIKIRLITNGSYISKKNIKKALTSIKKFDFTFFGFRNQTNSSYFSNDEKFTFKSFISKLYYNCIFKRFIKI